MNSFYQRILLRLFERFPLGELELILLDGKHLRFGSGGSPSAQIVVHKNAFFQSCVLHGNVGLGESYIRGEWETPDIRAVVEWFALNLAADPQARGSSQKLKMVGILRTLDRIGHRLRRNSKDGSRQNIEKHYDLGNDFYKLWLDGTMTYSSARFASADESLEEAQRNKYEALCQKLRLCADDHLLEIGCGWGGFSIYAACIYGCRVTAVTLSKAQLEEATMRVAQAGLANLVEIRLQDYRDIEGSYDKIASIEMVEAVGDEYLETWCKKVTELLKPHGLVAIQMITVPDNEHRELKRGTDFIQKHIFPGSLLLSIGRMNRAFNVTGNLFLHGLEDLGTCYHRTLRHWFDNFNAKAEQVRALGFDESFIRKWNYYLKYCEAGFATRTISVVQGVYTRPANAPRLNCQNGVVSDTARKRHPSLFPPSQY